MLTGKIHIETKRNIAQLLVEIEIAGKKEWRELNTLPRDYQRQVIASNEIYANFIDRPDEVENN